MDFIHHTLEKTEQGYIVYLYLDPHLEEFSAELGTTPKEKRKNLRGMISHYVKDKFPGVTVVTAKVMIGTTLFTTIPMQNTASAHDASFNMSYLYFGNKEASVQAVDQTQGNLNVISPSYFDLNSDGSLKLTSQVSTYFISEMHKRGVKVVPFLSNHWDRSIGRAALANRETLSTQIAEAIVKYNLDGVNVDIENVSEVDRDNYTDLVRLLREKLPADKEVSVAIAANPNHWTKGWHGSYDNNELAKYADYLMLMAYDEHFYSGEPGPVASISWVERSIQSVLEDGVPPEKLVLGLPFFGRYWNDSESVGGYGASNTQVEALVRKYNGTINYDETAESPKATFTIEPDDPTSVIAGRTLNPGTYEAWYENNQSIHSKIELVHKYNLKGTGSWSLGQENTSVWNQYGVWLAEHNQAVPVSSDPSESQTETVDNPGSFPFTDATDHWARDEILYASQKGWFKGTSSTTFSPQEGLTRSQAAAVFVRLLDLDPLEPLTSSSFSDVTLDDWAGKEIEIAKQHGIFQGKSDGTFGQNEILTREQMAKVFDNTFKGSYDPTKQSVPVSFTDVPRSSSFYDSIIAMKQQGFFEGYGDQTFRPGNQVTRAQMVKVLTNASDRISQFKGETVFPRTLLLEREGDDVTLLQIYLKKAGFLKGNATGHFDSQTERAVRSFQQEYSLAVDGYFGPQSRGKLLEVIR